MKNVDLRLMEMLERHEGFRRFPYKDTEGYLTIGIGRNLVTNGVSHSEAVLLLERDLIKACEQCESAFQFFDSLDDARQAVLVNMVFNMGLAKVKQFKNTLEMVEAKDFAGAASEMIDSKWAKQVGQRAVELAKMMETGQWTMRTIPND